MKRVCAIAAVLSGLAAADAAAQVPGGTPRIGYFESYANPKWAEAFQRGMSELGYVENRTIVIERRSAAGQLERLPDLVALFQNDLAHVHIRKCSRKEQVK